MTEEKKTCKWDFNLIYEQQFVGWYSNFNKS